MILKAEIHGPGLMGLSALPGDSDAWRWAELGLGGPSPGMWWGSQLWCH